jgi:hypothetical protein
MDKHGVKPRGGHAAIRGWTRILNRKEQRIQRFSGFSLFAFFAVK